MASCVNFHSQLASIMEVLANAAVAEICQLVDNGFDTLRLEISRSQRENLTLKSRLRLMEPIPAMVVTHTSKDHHFGEDPTSARRHVKSTSLENTDTQLSRPVVETVQPVHPEENVIKKERLEEEQTTCSVLGHQTAPSSSIGPQSLCLAAENDLPLYGESEVPRISVSGWNEKEDFTRPEALQQEEEEGTEESSAARGQCAHSADQSHRVAPRGSGSSRAKEITVLKKEGGKNVCAVDPSDSLSAEPSRSKVPDVEIPQIKTLNRDLLLTNSGVNGFWRAEGESVSVKTETEPSWSETFGIDNPLVSIPRNECMNSRQTHSSGESEAAESRCSELDTNSFDSSSFDDLFSSPEVARSLTTPQEDSTGRVAGIEERFSSPSFLFLSSFGNTSTPISDSVAMSSFSNSSSDSRSRGLPSSTEQVFSCPQCSQLFSSSRDLVVHQRSHGREGIFHCHLCKKPFIHPHQLKTHQRVHTGEKPFSCTQCGKRFSQSSHIKRHMSVHTGEKRYSCSLCGKCFSQACSLKVHQAVHTGERPYSCAKCGKSFSVLGNLVRHQSVHISK